MKRIYINQIGELNYQHSETEFEHSLVESLQEEAIGYSIAEDPYIQALMLYLLG